MIKTKTLFILGAGASKPFGYPTAIELRDLIRKRCFSPRIADAYYSKKRIEAECLAHVEDFIKAFSGSSRYSIDNFLEHRPGFMEVGKMAIAAYLIDCEHKHASKLEDSEGNWYMYLYDRLKSSFEEFDKNKISFITFNYDRSLEQFLFNALKYSFGKTKKECARKLNQIPIVHLYGRLDSLPWEDSHIDSMNNSSRLKPNLRIRQADDNLKLISDERDIKESKEFQAAHNLIGKAQIIYFLGFGFDKNNLKRLNIKLMKDKTIIGTSLGLANTKKTWIEKYFGAICGKSIILRDIDTLEILQEYLLYESNIISI